MVIENIDVNKTLEKARQLLKEDKQVSPAIAAVMEVLILLVTILANRLGLNSKNSSIPPSQDPNRARKKKAAGEVQKRKPGGQQKHAPSHLQRRLASEDESKKRFLAICWSGCATSRPTPCVL